MNKTSFLSAVFITLTLSIIPLPEWLALLRPAWCLLFILFIQFYIPAYYHLALIILIGLCLDVLLASVIGEHVFALVLSSWLATIFLRRFHFFPIGQQILLIFVLALTYQLALGFIEAFLGNGSSMMTVLGAPLLSCLLWPWVRIIFSDSLEKVSV